MVEDNPVYLQKEKDVNSFCVLNAADPVQYALWINTWIASGFCEVAAHPQYATLFSRECDYTYCVVMQCPTGLIMLPIILRPLYAEEWAGDDSPYYDIDTPYGFGGPYIKGDCNMTIFWEQFDQWARNNGVVSAFFRLSPFVADMKKFTGTVETVGGNVIRSLTEGKEDIWRDYNPKVRCNVRRAEREGLYVEIDRTGKRLDDFMNIYYGTMERRNALAQYYFKKDFFQSIVKNLVGNFVFFHAIHCGKVISTELVLVSQDNLYAFLGGTDAAAFGMHPNELIKHTIVTWGVDQGKKTYVLGGGYAGNDGILRYKKEFAPRGIVPFAIGKRIYNESIYQDLCEKRKRYEVENAQKWDEKVSYFPQYRAHSIKKVDI